nr:LRR receptor-like serine/threonine-protein kinase GSO1 [Ipomoea batatas]
MLKKKNVPSNSLAIRSLRDLLIASDLGKICIPTSWKYDVIQVSTLEKSSKRASELKEVVGKMEEKMDPLEKLGLVDLLQRLGVFYHFDDEIQHVLEHMNTSFCCNRVKLSKAPKLEVLDLRNNTLSGNVPLGLKRLNEGFRYENNPGLCGTGFPSLALCSDSSLNPTKPEPFGQGSNHLPTKDISKSANIPHQLNENRKPQAVAVVGVIGLFVILAVAGLFTFSWKSSGNYNNSKNASHDTNDQPSNYSRNNSKGDRRIKALAVEEKSEEKTDEPKTSSSSSKSDCSEDKKGLLCLFSHEDSDEELCCMAEEEEVTSQNCSSSYSSESSHHENSREAFERMMKDFNDIESTHFKLKEENAQLLAERQDLEDLKWNVRSLHM